ncbi:response regulator, partial [Aduncisulcus paluster]
MVTDIMMPDMNGLELAKQTRDVSPHTMRIILSGSSQVAAIIDAINEGHVYKYIVKPWKIDADAIAMLEEAI